MTEWIKNKIQQYAAYKRFTSALETCVVSLNEKIEKYTLWKLLKREKERELIQGEKKKKNKQTFRKNQSLNYAGHYTETVTFTHTHTHTPPSIYPKLEQVNI